MPQAWVQSLRRCSFSSVSTNQGQSQRELGQNTEKERKKESENTWPSVPLQAWFSQKPGSVRKRDTEGGCSAAGQVASHSPGLRGGDPRSRSSGIGAFWENFLPTNFPRWAQKIHLDSTACNTGPRANAERLCCCPGPTIGGWEPQQQEKHRQ